jgi:hypothetical protein
MHPNLIQAGADNNNTTRPFLLDVRDTFFVFHRRDDGLYHLKYFNDRIPKGSQA